MTGPPVLGHADPPPRPAVLTVVLVLTCLGLLKAVWTLLFDPEAVEAAFPGMTPVLFGGYTVTMIGIAVTVAGLWRMRRWGLLSLSVVGSATVVLDVVAEAPPTHVAAGIAMTLLTLAALVPVRGWFLRGEGPAPSGPQGSSDRL